MKVFDLINNSGLVMEFSIENIDFMLDLEANNNFLLINNQIAYDFYSLYFKVHSVKKNKIELLFSSFKSKDFSEEKSVEIIDHIIILDSCLKELRDYEELSWNTFSKDSMLIRLRDFYNLSLITFRFIAFLMVNSKCKFSKTDIKHYSEFLDLDKDMLYFNLYDNAQLVGDEILIFSSEKTKNPRIKLNPVLLKVLYNEELTSIDKQRYSEFFFEEFFRNSFQEEECINFEADFFDEEIALDLDEEGNDDPEYIIVQNELEEEEELPYSDPLEYIGDRFKMVLYAVLSNHESERLSNLFYRNNRSKIEDLEDDQITDMEYKRVLEKFQMKYERIKERIENRLYLTLDAGLSLPRLEKLIIENDLDEFEIKIICYVLGCQFCKSFQTFKIVNNNPSISEILDLFCENLEQKLNNRRYFYKKSHLVIANLIHIDDDYAFERSEITIDQRLAEYIMNIDNQSEDIVEGSKLYTPTVTMDQVIISDEKKSKILDAISNYEIYTKKIEEVNIESQNRNLVGSGLVILFYGPSGTGKTLMAHAIANYMKKKILLVNMPSCYIRDMEKMVKIIFREATVNNAIIFFDECEDFLRSRNYGNSDVKIILTEIEKYNGVILMATNIPQRIDDAMHRRILLSVDFPKPHLELREKIWQKHLKDRFELADDVDLKKISYEFELTGGLIKNAVMTAIQKAISRDKEHIVINHEDLRYGAKCQMTKQLSSNESISEINPKFGLEHLILPEQLKNSIIDIINFHKNKQILFSDWGFFNDESQFRAGSSLLFYGPSGTGKTYTAQIIAYELGMKLEMIKLSSLVSSYVGQTGKNIENLFGNHSTESKILLFDDADALFSQRTKVSDSVDRYANMDVDVLLTEIEKYQGIIILTSNFIDTIDQAMFRRFNYILEFKMPDQSIQTSLWKSILPDKVPLADDVDFDAITRDYSLTGGGIKNVIFRACARAILRDEQDRKLYQRDLLDSIKMDYHIIKKSSIGF